MMYGGEDVIFFRHGRSRMMLELSTPTLKGRGGGRVQSLSCMAVVCQTVDQTVDPRIPTMPGRSSSGFHRPSRHCLHQAEGGGGGWGTARRRGAGGGREGVVRYRCLYQVFCNPAAFVRVVLVSRVGGLLFCVFFSSRGRSAVVVGMFFITRGACCCDQTCFLTRGVCCCGRHVFSRGGPAVVVGMFFSRRGSAAVVGMFSLRGGAAVVVNVFFLALGVCYCGKHALFCAGGRLLR